MESDSEDQRSSSSLDDEEPHYEGITFEEELLDICDVPGSDDESEDTNLDVLEENSSSDEGGSQAETSQTKSANHSDTVRCNKIVKLLKSKRWKPVVKRVNDVSDLLMKSIQYHDINDMMPVDGKFLVDGDSLLIFALSDEEWGGKQHGQMLHVIYICERILRVFTRIGGICELIFFQNWENVWADKFVTLARTVLMAHFKHNTNYAVHILPNAWDESFKSVLESTKPNFLLQYLEFSISNIVPKCCASLAKMIAQVNMNFIIASGVDIVDMFGINLTISTINAFVIKGKRLPNKLLVDSVNLLKEVPLQNVSDRIGVPTSTEDVRRDAFISAAAAVLVHNSSSRNLVRVFLLKCALMEVIPLKLRACPKVEVDSVEVRDFVSSVLHHMNVALLKNLKFDLETPLMSKLCVSVADIWQENFFYKLLTTLNELVLKVPSDLGNDKAAAYASLVERVNNLCTVNFTPFPVDISKLVLKSTTNDTGERDERKKVARETAHRLRLTNLIPSTSPLMKDFCGESVLQNCWNAQEYAKVHRLICRNKEFREIYHWHSKRKLVENTRRVPDSNLTKLELKKKQRLESGHAYYMQFYGNNLEGNKIVSETIVRDMRRGQRPQKAKKEKKTSHKASIIKNEIDQKRKKEIIKDESERLKTLKSLQNSDINKDIATKIAEVKSLLRKITSDEVRRDTEMLMATLYYKLLMFKHNSNEQYNECDKVFVEFFILLRDLLLKCGNRILTLCKNELDSSKPKIKQSKKAAKQKETTATPKPEENEEEIKMSVKDFNTICSYFDCLKFGEIVAMCKETIKSKGTLTEEIVEILEEPASSLEVFDTGFPWAQFQLNYLGPYLERGSLGVFDEELGFAPDDWQAELITVIRNRQSAIVVAPTSSGKTYASYYCMKSVLKESVDGVVVYVSPTKALVNQVAATVYARFKNTNMADGMCLMGVFTRDYRYNYENCQILVTVPECLEILLLSPKRTQWVKKLRFIIFDEIHCLSGIAGGISWESGLLLSKCPFLALSATIERPQVLEQWLKGAAEYKKERDIVDGLYNRSNDRNYEVKLIIYSERHNDLEKHIFANGKLSHVHPYSFLTRKIILQHEGVPKTLSLSPKETLQLYQAMKRVVMIEGEITHLIPEIFFSVVSPDGFITKQHVRSYESALNEKLYYLAQEKVNCFHLVLTYLRGVNQIGHQGNIRGAELFDLVENLNKSKMLPAIIFSYNRNMVEGMFADLTDYYTSKDESSEGEDEPRKKCVEVKTLRKGKEVVRFNRREIPSLNLLSRKNSIQTMGVADGDDVKYIEKRLWRSGLHSDDPFVCGLRCGVGMHHGGLNRDKRTAVEMLFRMKLLNVLFATGTLALGIHMPCKTVVIAGETRFLNVLNYHQMAGRAGRRGFDTEGNLVFWNVSDGKISNLMTTKLPVMWGNIPMTVSVILRLLLLVSQGFSDAEQTKEERKWNVSRALTFLNCNLVYQHFPDLKQQMKHYFAFSNQLLMVQQLLDDDGIPQALAGIVTHLHYHEPGNLVFVYLLRHGIFNKICKEENGKISKQTELNLVLVLSHLFTNTPLRKHDLEKKFKNSKVILDKMPEFVIQEIKKYNEEVLIVFDNYFKCVAKECQEQIGEDNSLPLSAVSFVPSHSGASDTLPSSLDKRLFTNLEERLICSSFAALSGHGDVGLYSNESLFSTIRHQVFTDMKILPQFPLNRHLNAYAWDFYNHGNQKAVIIDNNLKEGADFNLLKDFSMVLLTLYNGLLEFDDVYGANKTVVEAFRIVSGKFSALFAKAYGIRQ